MSDTAKTAIFPVLPLRDIVVFPHMIVPLFVGRDKSVKALEDVMQDDKQILLVAQKNAGQDDPAVEDIYEMGTIGTVLQLLKLPDGTVKVLVEGSQRAKIVRYTENDDFFQAEAELLDDAVDDSKDLEALSRSVVTQFEQYIKLNKKIPPEVLFRSIRLKIRANCLTRSRRTLRSRSPKSRNCWNSFPPRTVSSVRIPSWNPKLAFCRLKSVSGTA